MRHFLLLSLLLLAAWTLAAEITPFVELGNGHIAGKLATYATGNTICMVINDNPGTDPATPSWIKFLKSVDGGVNWETTPVTQVNNCLTHPTLFYSPGEILIAYTDGYKRLLARSLDGGSTWVTADQDITLDLGRSFENSPVVEHRNGELRLFSLNLPYPEHAQDQFAHPADQEELLAPQYFTAIEESVNSTPVYWYGLHELNGVLRSNSDIWIKQAGGGNNNGWPRFNAPVIIGGEVQSASGAYPADQVFAGGLIENAPFLEQELPAGLRANAAMLGPIDYDPDHIMLVEVNGSTFTAWLGQVLPPVMEFADVYSAYPPPNPDTFLFTNNYAKRDTLWTFHSNGTCSPNGMFVNSRLWIKGSFSGHQNWLAADTISVIGDILLSGTPAGTSPETNTTDSVKLISEKGIEIKYGYCDPVDSQRYHLCRADTDPIMIYADFYCLGHNPANPRQDGVFTFEYQHPHPSVPAVVYQGTLYDNIDLHRRTFPQTTTSPWPPLIDYPWYNPLWPERIPYLERGILQIWGSVNQSRRGYLHRSYLDSEWPSNGVWDQTQDFCGGSSSPSVVNHQDPVLGIQLTTQNFPGTAGGGTGYKPDYRYNPACRLSDAGNEQLADWTLWKLGMHIHTWQDPDPEAYYLKQHLKRTHCKAFARSGNLALYAQNDKLLLADNDDVFQIEDLSDLTHGDGDIRSLALGLDGAVLLGQTTYSSGNFQHLVKTMQPLMNDDVTEYLFNTPSSLFDVAITPTGGKLVAMYEVSGVVFLYRISDDGQFNLLDVWQMPQGTNLQYSRIYLLPSSSDELEVLLWQKDAESSAGSVFHAHASFSTPVDDPALVPVPELKLSAFPNPATSRLWITVQPQAKAEHQIVIFNLKGQKVRTLTTSTISKENQVVFEWNGRDENGRPAGSGIYLLHLYVNGRALRSRKICWL